MCSGNWSMDRYERDDLIAGFARVLIVAIVILGNVALVVWLYD